MWALFQALHGEWLGIPGSQKRISDERIWLYQSEALILNSEWIAHPEGILFQLI
jgi:hypothetical protein